MGICDFLLVGFEFSRKISLNFQKRSENQTLFARWTPLSTWDFGLCREEFREGVDKNNLINSVPYFD